MILNIDFNKFFDCVTAQYDKDQFFGAKSKWFMVYRIDKNILFKKNKIEVSISQVGHNGMILSSVYVFEKEPFKGSVSVVFKQNPLTRKGNLVFVLMALFCGFVTQEILLSLLVMSCIWLAYCSLYFFQRYVLCRREMNSIKNPKISNNEDQVFDYLNMIKDEKSYGKTTIVDEKGRIVQMEEPLQEQ